MEHSFVTDIVTMIVDHWEVFQYVFLGLAFKYVGDGLFMLVKSIILATLGIKKMFGYD